MLHMERLLTTVERATGGHGADLDEEKDAQAAEDGLGVIEYSMEADESDDWTAS
jgi:hypothetical protein